MGSSDARLAGGIQDVTGTFHVGAIKLLGLACSQPVVCRDMEKPLAIDESPIERCAIREVTLDDLHRKVVEIAAVRALADQGTDLPLPLEQSSGDCRADKAGSARDQRSHEMELSGATENANGAREPARATAASERLAAR